MSLARAKTTPRVYTFLRLVAVYVLGTNDHFNTLTFYIYRLFVVNVFSPKMNTNRRSQSRGCGALETSQTTISIRASRKRVNSLELNALFARKKQLRLNRFHTPCGKLWWILSPDELSKMLQVIHSAVAVSKSGLRSILIITAQPAEQSCPEALLCSEALKLFSVEFAR
jgi:hypothetical protein